MADSDKSLAVSQVILRCALKWLVGGIVLCCMPVAAVMAWSYLLVCCYAWGGG